MTGQTPDAACPRGCVDTDGCGCEWNAPNVEIVIAPSGHVHEWEPVGLKKTTRRVYDGITNPVVPITLAIRSCKCGAIRRTEV